MAKITIIGWYGTETIGDRAILAGLFKIFSEIFSSCEIFLGSLYPVLSERTLIEDKNFHDNCFTLKQYSISLFNCKEINSLKRAIKTSDYVIVGGGPLMDIQQMHYLEYAFRLARQYKKRKWLLGVGWGPLREREFIKAAKNLIELSDLCIMRDECSVVSASKERADFSDKVFYSCDLAVFATQVYRSNFHNQKDSNNGIVINFRKNAEEYYKNRDAFQIYKDILSEVLKFKRPVKLVPMHTFYIGDDDRIILNMLEKEINNGLVTVENSVLNLKETMDRFANADFCIGCRFHSVVLQTFLNGKNYIVDYTNKKAGKIKGFIDLFGLEKNLSGRYISLEDPSRDVFSFSTHLQPIIITDDKIEPYWKTYVEKINNIGL